MQVVICNALMGNKSTSYLGTCLIAIIRLAPASALRSNSILTFLYLLLTRQVRYNYGSFELEHVHETRIFLEQFE